jgi:hypothetical protein
VEPWRRDEDRDGMRGGGVREAVGMQTPRGCACGGRCCILQQLLQLLLELLQFPSVLQNADADRAATFARDSLIMNSKNSIPSTFYCVSPPSQYIFLLHHHTYNCLRATRYLLVMTQRILFLLSTSIMKLQLNNSSIFPHSPNEI